MIAVCCYFQVHQPFRLRKDYRFFDIGLHHQYDDDATNRAIIQKVAAKCYLPANAIMRELIDRHEGAFRISYSLSGVALEQFARYAPEVLESFQALVATGCVELLGETYYHSLAFLFSPQEFRAQVAAHREKVRECFSVDPCDTFRNTELIYNNALAAAIEQLGYRVILTEGADHILGWRNPNFVYQPAPSYRLRLLLKNYKLSDDVAFRFSNRDWDEFPLNAEKYARWITATAGNGEVINLFMDYETFGEHQWADTGIFEFLRHMPGEILKHPDFVFRTPREVAMYYPPVAKIDIPYTISWADIERDTTAWLGNPMQDSAAEYLYSLERAVHDSHDVALIHDWRKLQTSDHYYYMCTKWFSDGDVHKYFNPYDTPHQAYVTYTNVLNDIRERLRQRHIACG
ncbi:MAG: alpha-amylase [Deltaproteobacteria bacterium]|nr:alpha-amylase [Deltaproteobacteria bacterium]